MEQQGYKVRHDAPADYVFRKDAIEPDRYRAALYLRLSRDDGQAADSSSIESQRMLLLKFCNDNGYVVYDVYVDDGFSGLNFDRPDFQRMLGDIETGNVNLVITKDQSRLGRDYIRTGDYIENYFAERGIRYIAVNDGADTARPESSDFMPFRNVFNNMYCKDISRKTKSAKRQRALNGLFIGSNAPYGYRKHLDNRNKLVIDPDAANVVQEIFRLALEGKGLAAIGRTLSERKVLTPSAYKTAQGLKGFVKRNRLKITDGEYRWGYTTVRGILREYAYTGAVVNRKNEVVNYKTGKTAAVPREQQIIVEGMHEAIISRDDYDRVQPLIASKYQPTKHRLENVFRGLVYCADCGRKMPLTQQKLKATGKTFRIRQLYRCTARSRSTELCPHPNYIYADNLSGLVLAEIRKVLALVKDDETALAAVLKLAEKNDKRDGLLAEKDKLEKRLAVLSSLIRKLYEDYATEVLSGENYKEFVSGYQREQSELGERLKAVTAELGNKGDYSAA